MGQCQPIRFSDKVCSNSEIVEVTNYWLLHSLLRSLLLAFISEISRQLLAAGDVTSVQSHSLVIAGLSVTSVQCWCLCTGNSTRDNKLHHLCLLFMYVSHDIQTILSVLSVYIEENTVQIRNRKQKNTQGVLTFRHLMSTIVDVPHR